MEALMEDTLALIKEQEAVVPTLIREGRNKYNNDYVCPGCGNELFYGQNYCSECGRPVKWDA
jgi:predicted amidophosphoribosyltransferase